MKQKHNKWLYLFAGFCFCLAIIVAIILKDMTFNLVLFLCAIYSLIILGL